MLNDQDDLIWHSATVSGKYISYYIKASDHKNETSNYITHIYITDSIGQTFSYKDILPYINLTENLKEVDYTVYNNHKYVLYNPDYTWSEAKEWCETQGGHLVTISDSDEWEAVKSLLSNNGGFPVWLGGQRVNNIWAWVDNTPFSYNESWEENQPDNANGTENYLGTHCGGYYLDCYSWNDYEINPERIGGFVCEFDESKNTLESNSSESETSKPTDSQPATNTPTDSAEIQPVTNAPTVSTETQPVTSNPTEPIETQPITDKPTEAIETQPVTNAPDNPEVTQPVTEKPTEAYQPTEPAFENSKKFLYLPSSDDQNAGYNYKLLVQDNAGNIKTYIFEATEMKLDGVTVYSAEIPADITPAMIQYQVYDGDNWVKQIVKNGSELTELIGKVIKSDGSVYGGSNPVVTEPNNTSPEITQPVVTEPVVTNPAVTEPAQSNSSKPSITSKKDNPIKVTVKAKTIKAKKLKKKAQKIKAITVNNAQGTVTFNLIKSGITKKIRKLVKINSKGVITIKKWKKAKKGTYKIKVKVTAKGNTYYYAKTVKKIVKVKVK